MKIIPLLLASQLFTSTTRVYPNDARTLAGDGRIDRHALVTRHNITWDDLSGRLPLGNGEFCFTADGTGLQTFGGNSMAHWAWHSFPLPAGRTAADIPATGTLQKGRNLGPDEVPQDKDDLRNWMFDNPHIMNLGRLRLKHRDGRTVKPVEISGLKRTLDLWRGLETSHYRMGGQEVTVETCVHPGLDLVAVRVESPLVASGELEVALDFAYPSLNNSAWVGNFARTTGHVTTVNFQGAKRLDFTRIVDAVSYHAALAVAQGVLRTPASAVAVNKLVIQRAEYGTGDKWADVTTKVAALVKDDRIAQMVNYITMNADPAPGMAKRLKVSYNLGGQDQKAEFPDNQAIRLPETKDNNAYTVSARGTRVMTFVCAFSGAALPAKLPTYGETKAACAAHWEQYWSTGGAIDLSASKDSRWFELERRIVLSQYLMAAQSAGSWLSSENGLMGIDPWRGQFHMEMVWWHLAHYALWDRWSMADEALRCYSRFTPSARALAAQLGYKGLKWPKSVGPEGRSAPWIGNQVLLWKQPHPIFFAELEYRLRPTRATLDKWADIVQGTAEHMADYPIRDEKSGVYSLTPAMPPSEQGISHDTVFDLAYWRWGLDKAQEWRQRRGLAREPQWDEVCRHLAPLPTRDGVYVHSPEWTDTYTNRVSDHPDPIGVFGMLPAIHGVDSDIAHRTVIKVWETWNWKSCWGWDFAWMAMAAARNGEPQLAIEALLKESGDNSRYDIRGLSGGWYMPGNGGLLYAAAMMAAGWDGAPAKAAPGFPSDGSWTVRWEGLKKAP